MGAFTSFKGLQMAEGTRSKAEMSTLSTNNGETTGINPGTAEIQSTEGSGRSNVVEEGTEEHVTIKIDDNFNAGVAQTSQALSLTTATDTLTNNTNNYQFPIGGAMDSLPTGWTFTPGLGNGTNALAIAAKLTNNTGSTIYTDSVTVTMTIQLDVLPIGGTFKLDFYATKTGNIGSRVASGNTGNRTTTGSYAVNFGVGVDGNHLNNGDSLYLWFYSGGGDAPAQWSITDMTINTGYAYPALYNLYIDTLGTIFSGQVFNTFSANDNATLALEQIGTEVEAKFSTIEAGSVFNSTISTSNDHSYTSYNTGTSFVSSNQWAMRTGELYNSPQLSFSTWSDLVNNYLIEGANSGNPFYSLGGLVQFVFTTHITGSTITFTSGVNTATYNLIRSVAQRTTNDFGHIWQLGTLVSSSGTPPTSGAIDITYGIVLSAKAITLDCNTTTDISQTFTITARSGSNITEEISATDGVLGGTASTYTLTDYSGTEITSLTSSVTDSSLSDLASVLTRLASAVNTNTETPVDFSSTIDSNTLLFNANSNAVVSGLFSVTVNHHGSDGTSAFAMTTEVTTGIDPVTNQVTYTISGGGLTTDYVITADSVSSNNLINGLIAHVAADGRVASSGNSPVVIEALQDGTFTDLSSALTGTVYNEGLTVTTVTNQQGIT